MRPPFEFGVYVQEELYLVRGERPHVLGELELRQHLARPAKVERRGAVCLERLRLGFPGQALALKRRGRGGSIRSGRRWRGLVYLRILRWRRHAVPLERGRSVLFVPGVPAPVRKREDGERKDEE